MIAAGNIHYELADRVQGLCAGGIGASFDPVDEDLAARERGDRAGARSNAIAAREKLIQADAGIARAHRPLRVRRRHPG